MASHQLAFCFPVPESLDERLWRTSPDNPDAPLSKYVGNRKSVDQFWRAAAVAYERPNHCCADQSYAICGPPSTGKTSLARLFAETVRLPFVEIQPNSVKSVEEIINRIDFVCKNAKVYVNGKEESLELVCCGQTHVYKLPPIVVFIDEAHMFKELKKQHILEALLNATEHDDRILRLANGWEIWCHNVCWILGTTDRGDLPTAFDSRFVKINLSLYNKKEMTKIVKIKNPDWDDDICGLVAHYGGKLPREVLSLARAMRLEKQISTKSWKEIAAVVAEQQGIDKFGMTYQRVKILTALGQRPIAQGRMPLIAGCKIEELREFVMPVLMQAEDESNPLSACVIMTSAGYSITPHGLRELIKREIPNRSSEAFAKDVKELCGIEE